MEPYKLGEMEQRPIYRRRDFHYKEQNYGYLK